jgi:hypothetical protein
MIASKIGAGGKSSPKFIEQRQTGDSRTVSSDFRSEDMSVSAFRTTDELSNARESDPNISLSDQKYFAEISCILNKKAMDLKQRS